jgi:hypothetical protein
VTWSQEQESVATDPDIAEKRKQLVQAAEEEVDHYVKLLEDAERSQKEVFLIVVQVNFILLFRSFEIVKEFSVGVIAICHSSKILNFRHGESGEMFCHSRHYRLSSK